jgi:hypothetical protein
MKGTERTFALERPLAGLRRRDSSTLRVAADFHDRSRDATMVRLRGHFQQHGWLGFMTTAMAAVVSEDFIQLDVRPGPGTGNMRTAGDRVSGPHPMEGASASSILETLAARSLGQTLGRLRRQRRGAGHLCLLSGYALLLVLVVMRCNGHLLLIVLIVIYSGSISYVPPIFHD